MVFWWGWGWGWVAALVSGLVWIVLLLVGIILLRRELPHVRRHAPESPALHLLEERYARGEITRAEFLERRHVLLHPPVGAAHALRPAEEPPPVENGPSFDDPVVAGEPAPPPPPVGPGGYGPVAPPLVDLEPEPPPPSAMAAQPERSRETEPGRQASPEPEPGDSPEAYAGAEPTLQLPADGPERLELEGRPTVARQRLNTAKQSPPAPRRRRPAT
jgi:putative membrane protein